jgi:hypothetical protein
MAKVAMAALQQLHRTKVRANDMRDGPPEVETVFRITKNSRMSLEDERTRQKVEKAVRI